MEMTPQLQVQGLCFRFETRALFERFSLTLEPGISWLRGANGAGKTTLLKLLAGGLTPHAGTILMAGIDSARMPLAYRLHSFMCGGDLPQLPWLTVQEFLDLHLALYPGADPAMLTVQLNAFGLMPTLHQSLATLSLGQHKKVQLALALTLPVRLLLIDEPFNGLDAGAMDYLRRQLSDPARLERACIVLTSHLDPLVPVRRTLDLDSATP